MTMKSMIINQVLAGNTASRETKNDIVFNVFLHDDITTETFLQSIISKDTYKWAMIRDIFKGKKNVSLTVADKYVESPFQCVLLSKLIKQLEDELEFGYGHIRINLEHLRKEQPEAMVTADGKFDTTSHRNTFLKDCMAEIVGKPCKVSSKRTLIRQRDLKLQTDDFTLYIRVEGGFSRGWQIKDKYVAALPANDILRLHGHDHECRNQYIHGFERNGVFYSIELQPNVTN